MSADLAGWGPRGTELELSGGLRAAIEVSLPGRGRAIFTTRATGNLSLAAGEGHEHGRAARDRLCEALGLRWLCAAPQVHGVEVKRVTEQAASGGAPVPQPADGHVTALRGLGMMVLAADCVPVVLGSERAVGALHAGWRGLAAGVLEQGVSALREAASTAAPHAAAGVSEASAGEAQAEIVAVIGPCAGPCCYKVGAEVLSALGVSGRASDAPRRIDLRALARERLEAAGVARVLDLAHCTICDERLFSHRREGTAAGRQAAIAWLR